MAGQCGWQQSGSARATAHFKLSTAMQLAMPEYAEYLRLQQAEWANDTNRQTNAIFELQEALKLSKPACAHLECYDISTLQAQL